MKITKLSEKNTRIVDVYQEHREEQISNYIDDVMQLSNESSKSHRFAALMSSLFGTTDRELLKTYFSGIETNVKFRDSDFIIKRGRVDNLCGNLIVEFEKDLSKTLIEAKKQLKNYSLALAQKQKSTNPDYLCLATDGIRFLVYIPQISEISLDKLSIDDINLIESDSLDIKKSKSDELYYFLDRYFFRSYRRDPTTEEFVKDFGVTSPSFARIQEALTETWDIVKNTPSCDVIKSNWEKYLKITYGVANYSDDLFIRHTYLATLAKLMAYFRLKDDEEVNRAELLSVLRGDYFRDVHRIINFLDQDFFSWVTKNDAWKKLEEYVVRFCYQLKNYNLKAITEDILKGLYQELVDPKDRHDLGEYYTPDWLAGLMINKVLYEKPDSKILDPACGSGAFLYQAIRYKRAHLSKSFQLKQITSQVFGVDIHPLAVIVAKTNYILALGDLLHKRKGDLYIPIFLADSLYSPEKLTSNRQLTIAEREGSTGFPIKIDNEDAKIPEPLFCDANLYDKVLDFIGETAKMYAESKSKIDDSIKTRIKEVSPSLSNDEQSLDVLLELTSILKQVIEQGRDSIWIFILKNLYKPLFWQGQIDCVIGNPPWLSLRYLAKDEYQERMKKLIKDLWLIYGNKVQLTTHLELATLFFVRAMQMYLVNGGKIAFVMPRSLFSADQHQDFRANDQYIDFNFDEIWDLKEVTPLFNVPSCVIFSTKSDKKSYPVKVFYYKGKLPIRNASNDQAQEYLVKKETKIYLQTIGEKKVWTETDTPPLDLKSTASPYKKLFEQGATIVPRSFWFIDVVPQTELGGNSDLPYVKTSKMAKLFAKEQFKNVDLQGNIEKQFIFETLLSTDMVPFGHLIPRKVVLPIRNSVDSWKMLTSLEVQRGGNYELSKWLNKCENIWNKHRIGKEKLSIYDWINYRNKLTNQNPQKSYNVLYSTSGTNIVACFIKNSENFIIDCKTYYYQTDNISEAIFLTVCLNSEIVNMLIKPMQSEGLYGPRDIHKKVWELPIPRFDDRSKEHHRLVDIGKICADEVARFLKTVTVEPTPHAIGRLRTKIRNILQKELAEIDNVVKSILLQ